MGYKIRQIKIEILAIMNLFGMVLLFLSAIAYTKSIPVMELEAESRSCPDLYDYWPEMCWWVARSAPGHIYTFPTHLCEESALLKRMCARSCNACGRRKV